MKCSALSGHLYDLNIIDCPKCSCGHNLEDNNQYLFKCPLFIVERDIMFTKLIFFSINITLNFLLFGDLSISSSSPSLKILYPPLHMLRRSYAESDLYNLPFW